MRKFFIEFIPEHIVITIVWLFLFFALVYLVILGWLSHYSEVSCFRAIRLINTEGSIVIDIRSQNNFYQSHIINSMHVSASDIRGGAVCKLFKFRETPLILVCSNGIMSCSIARYLYKLGFNRVYVLKGGMVSWNDESLPLVINRK